MSYQVHFKFAFILQIRTCKIDRRRFDEVKIRIKWLVSQKYCLSSEFSFFLTGTQIVFKGPKSVLLFLRLIIFRIDMGEFLRAVMKFAHRK